MIKVLKDHARCRGFFKNKSIGTAVEWNEREFGRMDYHGLLDTFIQ